MPLARHFNGLLRPAGGPSWKEEHSFAPAVTGKAVASGGAACSVRAGPVPQAPAG